ncbi:hypothetical protein TNCV_2602591 [Trichonephila clavipes]|nr:hypothetical protein TNCV_2602591 [Trichonephila clavipes]
MRVSQIRGRVKSSLRDPSLQCQSTRYIEFTARDRLYEEEAGYQRDRKIDSELDTYKKTLTINRAIGDKASIPQLEKMIQMNIEEKERKFAEDSRSDIGRWDVANVGSLPGFEDRYDCGCFPCLWEMTRVQDLVNEVIERLLKSHKPYYEIDLVSQLIRHATRYFSMHTSTNGGRDFCVREGTSANRSSTFEIIEGPRTAQPRYQKLCTPSNRCLRMWRTSAYRCAMVGLCSGDPS